MISFIEFTDYVVGPFDSLCENGMIDNLSECEKAAHQLNFPFEKEERIANRPGGCYVEYDNTVFFNNDWIGTPTIEKTSKPICGQSK